MCMKSLGGIPCRGWALQEQLSQFHGVLLWLAWAWRGTPPSPDIGQQTHCPTWLSSGIQPWCLLPSPCSPTLWAQTDTMRLPSFLSVESPGTFNPSSGSSSVFQAQRLLLWREASAASIVNYLQRQWVLCIFNMSGLPALATSSLLLSVPFEPRFLLLFILSSRQPWLFLSCLASNFLLAQSHAFSRQGGTNAAHLFILEHIFTSLNKCSINKYNNLYIVKMIFHNRRASTYPCIWILGS